MIRHFILTLSAFIILGCASGGGGGLSDDEGRFDFKRVTKFDGRVLDVEVTRENGRTIRLNTARDSAYSIPSAPLMPNHSGRSWTLLNTASDSATVVYALVNWDNDRQTDYLAAGWWLHFQGRLRFPRIPIFDAENGIFIDGPELDTSNPPGMPVTGEATYVGASGGLYAYNTAAVGAISQEPRRSRRFRGSSPSGRIFQATRFRAASVARETSRSGAPICTPLWGGGRVTPPPRPCPPTTRCISAPRLSTKTALSGTPT